MTPGYAIWEPSTTPHPRRSNNDHHGHEGDEITRRNIAHAVRILALGGKCEIDEGCPNVNIPYGDDRAVTIYFEGKHDNR